MKYCMWSPMSKKDNVLENSSSELEPVNSLKRSELAYSSGGEPWSSTLAVYEGITNSHMILREACLNPKSIGGRCGTMSRYMTKLMYGTSTPDIICRANCSLPTRGLPCVINAKTFWLTRAFSTEKKADANCAN